MPYLDAVIRLGHVGLTPDRFDAMRADLQRNTIRGHHAEVMDAGEGMLGVVAHPPIILIGSSGSNAWKGTPGRLKSHIMTVEHSYHPVPEQERDPDVGLQVIAAGRIRTTSHRWRRNRLHWPTISLCLQGGGQRIAGDWSYHATAPYVSYLPAEQVYDFESGGTRYEAIWINLTGHNLQQLLQDAGLTAAGGHVALTDMTTIQASFHTVLDLLRRRPLHYTDLAAAACYSLCMHLRMHSRPVDPRQHELLRRLEDASGGVAAAAASCGCSRQTYIRRFKAHFGITPWQHVLQQRIERACVLLADPELPVVAVGTAVGFPDPGHFARVFKRLRGCTPGQWRQRGDQVERA